MRQGTVILKSLAQLDQMFGETVLTQHGCVISQCFVHLSMCATACEAMQHLRSCHSLWTTASSKAFCFGLYVRSWLTQAPLPGGSLQSEHMCWLVQAALLTGTLQHQHTSVGMWQTGLESAGRKEPTPTRRWEHRRVTDRPLPSQWMAGCSLLGKPHMQASTPACKLPWRLARGQSSKSLQPCRGDALPNSELSVLALPVLEQI